MADKLRSYMDDSVAYPGGRAFFAPGDPLRSSAHLVPPEPGFYTIDMHGSASGVRIGHDKLTVDHLAALLEADPNWQHQPIRLLACHTGANGFAQQLADRLGVPVIAPTAYAGFADGQLFVTTRDVNAAGLPPILPPTGEMRMLRPRAIHPTRILPEHLPQPARVGLGDLDRHNPWGLRGGTPTAPQRSRGGLYFPDEREVHLGVDVDVGPDEPLPDVGTHIKEALGHRDPPEPTRPHSPGPTRRPPSTSDDNGHPNGNGGNSNGGAGGNANGGSAGGSQESDRPSTEDAPAPGTKSIYAGDERLWPDELAEIIAASPEWDHGPIQLRIRGGTVDPEFVQRLADLLGVPVFVAPGDVAEGFAQCSSGTLEVYDAETPVSGWRVFEPHTVAMEAP